MILDSSAIVAILLRESGWDALVEALGRADRVGVGVPTLVECGIVLVARLGMNGKSALGRFVTEGEVRVLSLDEKHWTVAVDAFARYGKGRHRAALNFGDCLTYATARLASEPLLCVGDDFAQTDIALVAI